MHGCSGDLREIADQWLYNHPEIDIEYGLYKEHIMVHSKIIIYSRMAVNVSPTPRPSEITSAPRPYSSGFVVRAMLSA